MATITEDQLAGWTGPSSTTEQDKQDRTERMIREAINAHDAFNGSSYGIYAKGSYANNTNVRSDSDVDIVVECQEVCYWEDIEPNKGGHPATTPYLGKWTPEYLRAEIKVALEAKFSGSVVSGTTAFNIKSSASRVDADVVPCFTFKEYFASGSFREGTKLFKTNGGTIENYPNLQLTNGRSKNTRTNGAYKKTVRILKRLENAMIAAGVHVEVPSYLVECLAYNCPDSNFGYPTWTANVRDCLATIYNQSLGNEPVDESSRWLEANGVKYLFHWKQKWTREGAHAFANAAWNYMEFE
jgi:predicted nucleotidyltransferase